MDKANRNTTAGGELTVGSKITAHERHFDVAEIAGMWKLSTDKVRRMFENEPGVMVIQGESPGRRARRYRTLRIPASVMTRVHRRLSNMRNE